MYSPAVILCSSLSLRTLLGCLPKVSGAPKEVADMHTKPFVGVFFNPYPLKDQLTA